jgi:hypothetical protein
MTTPSQIKLKRANPVTTKLNIVFIVVSAVIVAHLYKVAWCALCTYAWVLGLTLGIW